MEGGVGRGVSLKDGRQTASANYEDKHYICISTISQMASILTLSFNNQDSRWCLRNTSSGTTSRLSTVASLKEKY